MRTVLLLAGMLQGLSGVATSSPMPVPALDSSDRGLAAIPPPDIVRSAEDAHRALRSMTEGLENRRLVDEVQRRLPELVAKVDPQLTVNVALSTAEVLELRPALQRADQTLAVWDGELQSLLRATYAAKQDLQRMDAVWAATQAGATEEGVSPALLERIAGVRTSIAAARARAREQLDRLFGVQDQVAAVRLRIADALVKVREAERLEAEQLFEVESVPLWTLLSRPDTGEQLRKQIAQALRVHALALRDFAWFQSGRLLFLLGTLVVLTVALWRGRRRLVAEMSDDPEVAAAAQVLRHPFASVFLLTLGVGALVLVRRPLVVSQIMLLGMLVAFVAAGGSLIPDRARPSSYALAILVALHVLSTLAPELSLLRRGLLLAVSAAGALVLVGELRRGSWESEMPSPRWRTLLRYALIAGTFLLLASVVANAIGNVSLAQLLTTGTLGSAAAALVLSGIVKVLRGLLVIPLRSRRVNRWPLIASNATLLRSRGTRYLRWGAGLVWLLATAELFRMARPLWVTVRRIVGFRARVGALDLSLGDILAFGITLWISVLLGRLVGFLLEHGLTNRGLARGMPAAISRSAMYAVIAVGTVLAFLASGMEVTKLTVLVGTLGVGIGFGLQNVVNNFVSGLILLYERPVQVGDVVEVGNVMGTVRRIGIRSSTVATAQGAEVVVPNAQFISSEVTNWTLSNRRRRIEIDVGVEYGAPPERVQQLLVQVATEHPAVLRKPEPEALFMGFGDSALNFQLRAWTDRFELWQEVASDLRTAITRVLGKAGISIPFPQRDLHLVSVAPSVSLPGDGGLIDEQATRSADPTPGR